MPDLKFTIGFGVEQNGQLDSYIKKLESSLNNISSKNGQLAITKELGLSVQNANQLKTMLAQVYHMDGSVNIGGLAAQIKAAGGSVDQLKTQYMNLGQAGSVAFNNLSTQIFKTSAKAIESSKLLNGAFDTFKNAIRYTFSGMAIRSFVSGINEAYRYVKNLDTALNDIRVVTGLASDEMEKFAVQAQKAAKSMGSDTLSYVKGALLYYQQGIRDANEIAALTDVTTKVSNVANLTTDEATSALTAVWKGYQIGSEGAESAIDKLAAVAANSAVNLEYLTTAMSKTASVANTMGLPIDQLNAMIATTGEVTQQSAETIGTAYKTIIARISDLKIDGFTEEDGVTISLGDVSGKLAKAGVNILDVNGQLRDTGDIITEIGSKWQDWDKAQKDAVASTIAGKRQYTQLFALFDNWDRYISLIETSANSQGELQKQQDIYMESTAAHLKQLGTEAERTYSQFFDTEGFNNLIDGLDKILTKFNDFTSGFHGLGNLLIDTGTTFTTVFSRQIADSLLKTINNFQALNEQAQLYNSKMAMLNAPVADNVYREKRIQSATGMNVALYPQNMDSNVLTTTGHNTLMSVEYDSESWNLSLESAAKYKELLYNIGKASATMSDQQKKDLYDTATQIAINTQKIQDYNDMMTRGVKLTNGLYADLNSHTAGEWGSMAMGAEAQAASLDKLQVSIDKVANSAGVLSRNALNNLKDELIKGQSEVNKGTAAYNKYSEAIKICEGKVNNAKDGFRELSKKTQESAENQRKAAIRYTEAGEAISGQKEKLEETNTALQTYIKEQNEAALKASKLQKAIMLMSGAVKVINAVSSAIKTLGDTTKSAEDKAEALQSTIVSGVTGIGTIVGALAGGTSGAMLGTAAGSLLGTIGSAIIDTDKLSDSLKTAKERLEDISKESNKAFAAQKKFASSYSDLKSIEKEWNELTSQIDIYGSDLSNLSDEEKAEYDRLKNIIIGLNEEAVIRWDSHGNAVINVNNALQDTYDKLEAIKNQDMGDTFQSLDDYVSRLRMDYVSGLDSAGSWFAKASKKNAISSLATNNQGFSLSATGIDTSQIFDSFFGIGGSNVTENVEIIDSIIEQINRKIIELQKNGNEAGAKNLANIQSTFKGYSELLHQEQDALDGLQKIDGKVALQTIKIDSNFNYDEASKSWDDSQKAFFDDLYSSWANGKEISEFETYGIEIGEELSILVNTGFVEGLQKTKKDYDSDLITTDMFTSIIQKTIDGLRKSGLNKELVSAIEEQFDLSKVKGEAFTDLQKKITGGAEEKIKSYLGSLTKSELNIVYKITESRESISLEELKDRVKRLGQLGTEFVNEMNFDSFLEQLDESVQGIDKLTGAINKLTEGTALTKSEMLDLIGLYPQLLEQKDLFNLVDADDQQKALNAVLDMEERMYDKQIDAKIAELEAQRTLINDQLNLEKEKQDLLSKIKEEATNGRLKSEQEFINKQNEYNDLQSENFFNMEEGKLAVNSNALTSMLTQEGEYAEDSTTNIWQPYGQVIADSHEEGVNGGLTAINQYGTKLAEKLKNIGTTVLNSFATAVKSALTGDLDGVKSAIANIFSAGAEDLTVSAGSVNVKFKGEEATIDQNEIENWVSEQKAATQKRIDELEKLKSQTVTAIENLEALRGLKLGEIYADDDGSKKSGGSSGTKEPTQFDKIAQSLENAAFAAEHYQNVYKNAHDSTSRIEALDNLTKSLEDQRDAIKQALEAYRALLAQYGEDPNLPADIKRLIDGDLDFSEAYAELNEDQKSAIDKYKEMHDSISDLEQTNLDVAESIREAWTNRIEEIEKSYESLINTMQAEAESINDSIKYKQTVGELVLGSNYFDLIDNAQKQLSAYKDEINDLYKMLNSAPDADAKLDLAATIREAEAAMRDLTQSVAEYIETIKEIPNTIYDNISNLINNNITDINNAIDETNAKGLHTTREQYEALISNTEQSTEYLMSQYAFLNDILDTYEIGSDKYYDTLSSLQSIQDSLSKNIQNTYKWQQAILEIPYDYLEAENDKIDDQLKVINNDIDAINKTIDKIDDSLDGLSRQIELIERDVDDEKEKQSELDDVIGAVGDAYQNIIDQANEEKDAFNDAQQEKIDALQDQLDLLNDNNEALDKQLSIEQALYDLDKAREQKTVRVVRNGRVTYEADQSAIREAEQAYAQALYNKKIYDLQQEIQQLEDDRDKQLEAYQEQIDALNEQAKIWADIVDNIEKAARAGVAANYFGSPDWAERITSDADYSKEQADIVASKYSSSSALTKYYENQIKLLEDQKTALEDQKYELEQQNKILERQTNVLNEQKDSLSDTKKQIEAYVKQWQQGQLDFDSALAGINNVLLDVKKQFGVDIQQAINGNDTYVGQITEYVSKQVAVAQEILDQLQQAKKDATKSQSISTTAPSLSYEDSGDYNAPASKKSGISFASKADQDYFNSLSPEEQKASIAASHTGYMDWENYDPNKRYYAEGVLNGPVGFDKDTFRVLQRLSTDAIPIMAHQGEAVLNPEQQAMLLKNIKTMQLSTLMGAPRFGRFGQDSTKIISISMGNLTLPNIRDGNDFADFLADNLENAVSQRINRR